MKIITTITALTVLALTGCSTSAGEGITAPLTDATPSATPPATPEADPRLTKTELRKLAKLSYVTDVEQTEPGRVTIHTDLVDTRGGGDTVVEEALTICSTAVAHGAEYVSVMEADGTTWVLFGHPVMAPKKCTEV